jgi:membrane protease YdiL (CAAX protease family)
VAARRAGGAWRVAAHVVMLAMCAGLMLHVMPGFNNRRLLSSVVLGPGAPPYSQYLNIDKLVAGLFLLVLYAPELLTRDEGWRHRRAFVWRFAVLVAVVIVLALALGYVRWDPKWPAWFPLWAGTLLVFAVMPEEALFRGVIQTWLGRRLGRSRAAEVSSMMIAGALFGIAHSAGGVTYVVLAGVAGIGYGWIFSATRSISAAIAAHTGLNAVHFLLFTYPALALPR